MRERLQPLLQPLMLVAVTLAVVVLAVTSAYSSWVASNSHHNACARTDLTLDTVHDVVLILAVPRARRREAFARIDLARC